MKSSLIRILYIASRSDIAGGEHYLLNVIQHIDRARFEPIFVLPGHGSFEAALKKLRVETLVMEANFGWLTPPKLWYQLMASVPTRVAELADLIRKKHICLVQTTSNMILEGALAAKLTGTPHIYVAQIEFQSNLPVFERFPLEPRTFAFLMHELSDQMVAVSTDVAKTFCPPLSPDQITVIYNGLDWEKFDMAVGQNRGTVRRELGLPEDALLITAVGRVTHDKGFDSLVEVAPKVLQENSKARFLLVGQDDDVTFADDLRRQVKVAGLSEKFLFLGYRQDVPRILCDSDVFVLSSRREGHPFVLLEAMACGLAPVATRCGGVAETVQHGKTGYVVEIGDVPAMASHISHLVRDENFRRQMGSLAQLDVRSRFGAKTGVDALAGLYEDILATPRPPQNSLAVDLFLRSASEIGTLGSKVTEMEERLRQVEHLARSLRENRIYRAARGIKKWLGGHAVAH